MPRVQGDVRLTQFTTGLDLGPPSPPFPPPQSAGPTAPVPKLAPALPQGTPAGVASFILDNPELAAAAAPPITLQYSPPGQINTGEQRQQQQLFAQQQQHQPPHAQQQLAMQQQQLQLQHGLQTPSVLSATKAATKTKTQFQDLLAQAQLAGASTETMQCLATELENIPSEKPNRNQAMRILEKAQRAYQIAAERLSTIEEQESLFLARAQEQTERHTASIEKQRATFEANQQLAAKVHTEAMQGIRTRAETTLAALNKAKLDLPSLDFQSHATAQPQTDLSMDAQFTYATRLFTIGGTFEQELERIAPMHAGMSAADLSRTALTNIAQTEIARRAAEVAQKAIDDRAAELVTIQDAADRTEFELKAGEDQHAEEVAPTATAADPAAAASATVPITTDEASLQANMDTMEPPADSQLSVEGAKPTPEIESSDVQERPAKATKGAQSA